MWHKQPPGYEVAPRNAEADSWAPSLRKYAEQDPIPPHHLSPVTCLLRKTLPNIPQVGGFPAPHLNRPQLPGTPNHQWTPLLSFQVLSHREMAKCLHPTTEFHLATYLSPDNDSFER